MYGLLLLLQLLQLPPHLLGKHGSFCCCCC
jgi:hypothetical protein